MKHKIFVTAVLLLGVFLFILTIQQTGLDMLWENLRSFSIFGFILYLTVSLINYSFFTYRWLLITRVYHKDISFWDVFWFRMVGYAVSYMTPSAQIGGEPARIYLMKNEKNIPIKQGTASVLIDKSLELSVNLFFVIMGFCVIIFLGFELAKTGLIIAILLFIIAIIYAYTAIMNKWGIITPLLKITRLNRISFVKKHLEKIRSTEELIEHFFHEHPSVLRKSIFISLLIQSFILLEHYILLTFFGFSPSFLEVFLIAIIPNIAYLIPTPGALGSLEGGYAIILKVLGLTSISAIAYSIIIRMRDIILVIGGLIYGFKHGFKLWK